MNIVCKQGVHQSTENKTDTLPGEEEMIVCAFCNHLVTDPSQQMIVDNSFHHVFANPHGHVFEIGCFSDAEGCSPGSIPSTEFSWFAGFSWEIGVCQYCSTHLGWIFSSVSCYPNAANNLKVTRDSEAEQIQKDTHNPKVKDNLNVSHKFFGLILEKLIFP